MRTLLAASVLAMVAVLVKASAVASPRPLARRGDAAVAGAAPGPMAAPAAKGLATRETSSASGPAAGPEGGSGGSPSPAAAELLARPADLDGVEGLAEAYPRLLKSQDPLADRVEAALAGALGDPSEDVRAVAVEGLGASAERNADRLQATYASEASPRVRAGVVRALSRSGEFLRRAITTDADADVRRFAAESARLHLTRRDCAWLGKARDAEADPSVRQALDDSMRLLANAK